MIQKKVTSSSIWKVIIVEWIFFPRVETDAASCITAVVRVDSVSLLKCESNWNGKTYINVVSLVPLLQGYMRPSNANSNGVFNDGFILLHDNTSPKLLKKTEELLKTWKCLELPPIQPKLWTQWLFSASKMEVNTYLEQGILQTGGMKTATENWLNGCGRCFYQTKLKKLVLRSYEFIHRFGDYVGKLSASKPLNSILYFLSIAN